MHNFDFLSHHGIKGMKWGIRRTPAQLGHDTGGKKPSSDKSDDEESKPKKKTVSTMSDTELQSKIKRLELEKRYRELSASQKEVSAGKKFVNRVLERAGENIATQFTTYVLGTATNKAFEKIFDDPKIVNPKKGQKD